MHSLWERRIKECERGWIEGQGDRIFCMAEKEFCRSAYNTNIFLVRAMHYFIHCRMVTLFEAGRLSRRKMKPEKYLVHLYVALWDLVPVGSAVRGVPL